MPLSAPHKTERNGTNAPLSSREYVCFVGTSTCVCAIFRPLLVGLQPHNRARGVSPIRILCVVTQGLWVLCKLQQHPAWGFVQQLGRPPSLLTATDILLALLQPLLHWLAHLLEWNRQLFVPQPADQLHDPHFPRVTVIMPLAQDTAVWQRRTADVVPRPQLHLAAASAIPLTHAQLRAAVLTEQKEG